jgi:hypothetical protein
MNGAVASNTIEREPDLRQVPGTGGEKEGELVASPSDPERVTVTTWSEGTPVAPWAGTVEATVKGCTGAEVVVDPRAAGGAEPCAFRPTTKAPAATATTTTTMAATIKARRCGLEGGTRIL